MDSIIYVGSQVIKDGDGIQVEKYGRVPKPSLNVGKYQVRSRPRLEGKKSGS